MVWGVGGSLSPCAGTVPRVAGKDLVLSSLAPSGPCQHLAACGLWHIEVSVWSAPASG